MRHIVLFVLLLSVSLVVPACGGDTGGQTGPPTKADIVALLRTLESSVTSGDLDAALATLVPIGSKTPEQMKPMLSKLLKTEGVTAASIAKAEAQGTAGPLLELWPERAAFWAKKAKVDIAECYGLKADPAEIGVHWDGSRLRFIRIDDLHKLP